MVLAELTPLAFAMLSACDLATPPLKEARNKLAPRVR